MVQILIHLWGDYLTQSDWMAQNKTKAHLPAAVHALVYSAPFLFVGSWKAVLVICATHFLIDRYRLARYVVWAKNWLAPIGMKDHGFAVWYNKPWAYCTKTGYTDAAPDFLAFWLLIIADNTLHLTINYVALRWL